MMRALLLVLLLPALARAEPDRCRALRPLKFAQLSSYAQRRFPGGEQWELPKEWQFIHVTLIVERAPHIARAVLGDCPGVTITSIGPVDAKRQRSVVGLKVTGFAALSRLAQLPAVSEISAVDSRREFEDPLL